MKLTTKFTLWYFGIMLVVLLIGGAIVYNEIQWKISRVEVVRHERLNDLIAEQIRQGGDYTGHPTRKRATVSQIPADSVPRGILSFYTRGLDWNPEFQNNEYKLSLLLFILSMGRITVSRPTPLSLPFTSCCPGWSTLSSGYCCCCWFWSSFRAVLSQNISWRLSRRPCA